MRNVAGYTKFDVVEAGMRSSKNIAVAKLWLLKAKSVKMPENIGKKGMKKLSDRFRVNAKCYAFSSKNESRPPRTACVSSVPNLL